MLAIVGNQICCRFTGIAATKPVSYKFMLKLNAYDGGSVACIHTNTPTTPFNQKQNFQNLITAQKWAPSAEFVVVVAMEAHSIVCVPVPFVECYLCNRPMCTVIHWYVKIAQISDGDTFESESSSWPLQINSESYKIMMCDLSADII